MSKFRESARQLNEQVVRPVLRRLPWHRAQGPQAPSLVELDTRKPLAALTFVWNEEAYLQRWVDYYSGQLGRENLFIFAHGEDPMVTRVAEGCRVYPMPRSRVDSQFARRKSDLAAGMISFLLAEYKTLIVGDVDEVVVIDPAQHHGLIEFVEARRADGKSLKPFNLDLLDDPEAGPLNPDQPVLAQRPLARTRYQFFKPVIVSDRIEFAAGFHYSDHHPVLAEGAYLVHIHYADRRINQDIAQARQTSFEANPNLGHAHQRSRGFWSKHMERFNSRQKGSANMPIHDLDDILPDFLSAMRGNVIQEPRTKINRPGWTMTFGDQTEKIRIRIPDRFSKIF